LWRWDVFKGKITSEEYNCEWWKLRWARENHCLRTWLKNGCPLWRQLSCLWENENHSGFQHWVSVLQWNVGWSGHCRLGKFFTFLYTSLCPSGKGKARPTTCHEGPEGIQV
jgi:hypothetical protein